MSDDGAGEDDAARGTFARYFLEHEMRASAGMGTAADRASLHLGRALSFLEQGMVREALTEANVAAHLDPALRADALAIARTCVLRELCELSQRRCG